MAQQIPVSSEAIIGHDDGGGVIELLPDLAYRRIGFVNIMLVGRPGTPWVLVDAGLPGTRSVIEAAVQHRFAAPPSTIVMTHGHADHTGVLRDLAELWDVPVYAHPLELPYLNGTSSYPPPDPFVGGGLMALASKLFPRGPVDVSRWLRPLPADGSVPGMAGWAWIHTPGHAPGHVSLWRAADRTLIAGDAFVTTAQESIYGAITQAPELHGPPMYFTPDWEAAKASVCALAALQPEIAVTGHGRAMHAAPLRAALDRLAAEFDTVAVPKSGRYVTHPARANDGTAYQ